jgi:nucleotide-binding universal stress UspA family protein
MKEIAVTTTILVGVDDSERSADAVAFAHHIARVSGADVIVANSFPYDDIPSRASNLEYRQSLQSLAGRLTGRMSDQLADLGEDRTRTMTVARTSPAHGLQDIAEAERSALVVVGSSHVGAARRVLPGSTAERLLHGAPCPVALVPRGYRDGEHTMRMIGVAHDGSSESDAALRAAIDVARATGATLRIIHVLDVRSYGSPAMMAGWTDIRDGLEEGARASLDNAAATVPDDVRVERSLAVGDPAHELAEQSRELDLLITGSRGYGPLRAVLAGGVTGRLLRQAECPVIVVPRGVEAPLGELFAAAAQAPA